MNRRLYRSRTDRVIGGVAGGVAEYLDADPAIVRVIWALLALVTGGVFLVLYIVMWIVVPEGPEAPTGAGRWRTAGDRPGHRPAGRRRRPEPGRRSRRIGTGGLRRRGRIVVGADPDRARRLFLVRDYFPQINVDRLWPLGLVALGVLLLLVAMRRRPA